MKTVVLSLMILALSIPMAFAEEDKVLATYDDGKVTLEELQDYWRYRGNRNIMVKSATEEDRVAAVVREVALREILLDYAHEHELDKAEGFSNRQKMEYERLLLDQLSQHEIRDKADVTDEEILQYYETHPDEFRIPEKFSIRHIFFDTTRDESEEAKAEKLQQAQKVAEMLHEGADFVEMAEEHSDSENQKGEVFTTTVGKINPVLENVALNLEVGEFSEPVEVRHGYQIIQLTAHEPEEMIPMQEQRDKIEQKVQREKFAQYRDELIEKIQALKSEFDVTYHLEAVKSVADIKDSSIVCRIGEDTIITGAELKKKLMRQSPERWQISSVTQAMETLDKSMVLREIALLYAKQLGLEEHPDFKFYYESERDRVLTISARRNIADQIVSATPVTDEEVRNYYDKHPKEFTTGKTVEYQLLEIPIEYPEDNNVADRHLAQRDAREKADALLSKARQGTSLKEISDEVPGAVFSPANEKRLKQETYMRDLDSQLLTSKVGDLPLSPLMDRDRYLIFKVTGLDKEEISPFASVKGGIRNRLTQTKKSYVDRNLQENLLKQHEFQLNEEALKGLQLKFHDE